MNCSVTFFNIYYWNPGCSLQDRICMCSLPCQHCHIWCNSDL